MTYDRNNGDTKLRIEYDENRTTLSSLWKRVPITEAGISPCTDEGPLEKPSRAAKSLAPRKCIWSCNICTFEHAGEDKRLYLACEVCGASRDSCVTKNEAPRKNEAICNRTGDVINKKQHPQLETRRKTN